MEDTLQVKTRVYIHQLLLYTVLCSEKRGKKRSRRSNSSTWNPGARGWKSPSSLTYAFNNFLLLLLFLPHFFSYFPFIISIFSPPYHSLSILIFSLNGVHTHKRHAVSSEELITTIYFPKVGYKRILLLRTCLLFLCVCILTLILIRQPPPSPHHLTTCVLQSCGIWLSWCVSVWRMMEENRSKYNSKQTTKKKNNDEQPTSCAPNIRRKRKKNKRELTKTMKVHNIGPGWWCLMPKTTE